MIAIGSFVLFIALALATPAPAADPAASLADQCVQCHGRDGRSTDPRIPNLAGQPSDYLVAQLWDFRKRRFVSDNPYWRAERRDPTMNHEATDLGDDAIEDLAAHFSRLSCGPAPNDDLPAPPQAAAGCAVCHGGRGIGAEPMVPNLAGQNARYLAIQMRNFGDAASVQRGAGGAKRRTHPSIASPATVVAESDVESLAAYYAALPCR